MALVDGEHYPPVVRDALAALRAQGTEPVAALVLGGVEKVARRGADLGLGVPTEWAPESDDLTGALRGLLERHRPDAVIDLSDEPVLDVRRRLRLAAHALLAGVPYETADAVLTPPSRPRIAQRPTIAVIGTGKRTGKTAIAGEVTRQLMALGRTPVVVAMGRGGPPAPVVVPAGTHLDAEELLRIADGGGHAASDFYEDALTTGAATVGARRCGGGLAGAVAYSNVAEAVRVADTLPGDLTVLEGSGAAVPPVHADVTVLVVSDLIDPEQLSGYLGAYRLLLADLIVVTLAATPGTNPPETECVLEAIRSTSRATPLLRTVLHPVPLGAVTGARVFFATTAPDSAGAILAESLQERFGCEVVGVSTRLANRPQLQADLDAAGDYEVLLVECKAAAVDVAVRTAARVGARVVFCDNRPLSVEADDGSGTADNVAATMTEAVARLAELATERFGR